MAADVEFKFVKVNGITLHVALAGPADGPLVILLHGFPEFWYGWRNQIEPLAKQGYRVVVPDQRGYNLSDKPPEVEDYSIDLLRDDIIGLINYFGKTKAVIIGHDWGGAVGWYLAATKPEYVEKFIPINIPHPSVMPAVMACHPSQLAKSSYMLFFQLPSWPEKLLQANDYKTLEKTMYSSSKPGTFSSGDMDYYKDAWSPPGAISSMLNWYRAIFSKGMTITSPDVTVPTRMIWGIEDHFLTVKSAKKSMNYCLDGELILVGDSTHWILHEQPELINKLITEF
ncbi:alpha/beta fold hydrolase [Thalassobacillus sp. C254]|uniref:alpha/beta fold hydrolase n=1 Tax=Thalassobacillus sp. C254 TaxID=1225341 RepID=UPI0006D122C6|nr:alpha/beta hydrolase [Thalassobacillus sp. C254]